MQRQFRAARHQRDGDEQHHADADAQRFGMDHGQRIDAEGNGDESGGHQPAQRMPVGDAARMRHKLRRADHVERQRHGHGDGWRHDQRQQRHHREAEAEACE